MSIWLDGKAYIFEVMGSSPVQTTNNMLMYRWKLISSIHVAGR